MAIKYSKWRLIYQQFLSEGRAPQKIPIFGMKIYHLATLNHTWRFVRRDVADLRRHRPEIRLFEPGDKTLLNLRNS
jgi:hypothetical protein